MLAFNHIGKLGQLGNQMFQYASLRGIAANKNYEWCIPYHEEVAIDWLGNKLRIELFDCFKLPHLKSNNIFMLDQGHAPLVMEKQFHFDAELFNHCSNEVSLCGYFQTEKYFKHIENEIREDFSFKDEIRDPCLDMIGNFQNPIALHVRRGDFLINSDNHFNLGLDYYEKSLSCFSDDRYVIIFSDDPEWCKEQKLFSDDRFLVSENNSNYIDMCLMSLCDDFIIANSTFSWWGAWLCENKNKKVLYPSEWFGPNNSDKSTQDLFPEDWRMIK